MASKTTIACVVLLACIIQSQSMRVARSAEASTAVSETSKEAAAAEAKTTQKETTVTPSETAKPTTSNTGSTSPFKFPTSSPDSAQIKAKIQKYFEELSKKEYVNYIKQLYSRVPSQSKVSRATA